MPCPGQPEKGRAVGGELPALDPAGLPPAVAQPASGAMACADQPRELIDADRVLLADQTQQPPVPLRQPDAAGIRSRASPPTANLLTYSRWTSSPFLLPRLALCSLTFCLVDFVFLFCLLASLLLHGDRLAPPLPLSAVWLVRCPVPDHPNDCRRQRAGGQERDAAGVERAAHPQTRIVERERGHRSAGLRWQAGWQRDPPG